jgi:hypothetical protein
MLTSVSSDTSSSFCLCALKPVLEEYALFTTDRLPPHYHSSFQNDIGFYIRVDSIWKPVNDATWIELASMINAPSGMYTYISINGINPINNGLQLDGLRSAHLADIITAYRSFMDYVNIFHENVIKTRSRTCTMETQKQSIVDKSDQNTWQQFFVPRSR